MGKAIPKAIIAAVLDKADVGFVMEVIGAVESVLMHVFDKTVPRIALVRQVAIAHSVSRTYLVLCMALAEALVIAGPFAGVLPRSSWDLGDMRCAIGGLGMPAARITAS